MLQIGHICNLRSNGDQDISFCACGNKINSRFSKALCGNINKHCRFGRTQPHSSMCWSIRLLIASITLILNRTGWGQEHDWEVSASFGFASTAFTGVLVSYRRTKCINESSWTGLRAVQHRTRRSTFAYGDALALCHQRNVIASTGPDDTLIRLDSAVI